MSETNSNENEGVKKIIKEDIDNYVYEAYDYEITISCWQKVLVVFLNILTGGLGTILLPFLNKKKDRVVMIYAGFLLGFFQIIHFLNFFSLLRGVQIIEDIYKSISEDKFLEIFFGKRNNDSHENTGTVGDSMDKNNFEYDISIFGLIIDKLDLNLSKTISQDKRVKFLKIAFGIISGMSYANSIITSLINFMASNAKEPNLKLSYKIMLYSFLNPGAGIILSSFSLFPYCRCWEKKYNIRGIILSVLGIILGIILMFSPISLIIASFLIKLTKNMITIYPLKITLILSGLLGVLFSFISSKFNKKTILEAKRIQLNSFDVIYTKDDNLVKLYSTIGFKSFLRFLGNMIIPGLGTLSLLFKYGFDIGIFLTGIIQFFIGFFIFLTSIIIIFKKNCNGYPLCKMYYFLFLVIFQLSSSDDDDIESKYNSAIKVLTFLFTIGLLYYLTGLILIFTFDYINNNKSIAHFELPAISCLFLNLFTGGLGTTLFITYFYKLFLGDNKEGRKYLASFVALFFVQISSYFALSFIIYFIFFHKNIVLIMNCSILYCINGLFFAIYPLKKKIKEQLP